MPLMQIKGLNKVFTVGDEKITAVRDVSLDIEQGGFTSIVGHSGSGKTTLISIIGGILKPTSGEVLVDGIDICSLDDNGLSAYRSTKIGFMFQFASLLPILTAKENVLLPVLFSPVEQADTEKRALGYLEKVGIAEKANAYPSQLSGGQQRRVAIARALMNRPRIILADEPTGDLDEETENEIMQLFRRVNEEENVSIILITHNRELAGTAKMQLIMSSGSLEVL